MMVIALLCGLRAASVNLVDRKDEYLQESRLKFNRYYRSTMAIIQETTYGQVTKMAGLANVGGRLDQQRADG